MNKFNRNMLKTKSKRIGQVAVVLQDAATSDDELIDFVLELPKQVRLF